jgi:hypothetical protein
MDNGGCDRLCPVATGLSLVALFSLSMSIEDHPLHWTLVKSQNYYPEHILAYGSGKTCYSLVVASGGAQTDPCSLPLGVYFIPLFNYRTLNSGIVINNF